MKTHISQYHQNYCPLFFKGLYTQVGSVPYINYCCSASQSIKTQTLNFYNDEFFQNNRDNWLHLPRDGCKCCWEAERKGTSSRRQLELEWMMKMPEVDEFKTELLSLDLFVGNLCNAACIMCGPISSSLWQDELDTAGVKTPFPRIEQGELGEIQNLDLSKLKRLYLVGGETLINKNTKFVLEEVKRQQGTLSNLNLRIQTNGSNFNDKHCLSLMKECAKVTLHVSLDAVGKEYEYIRYPLIWKEVEDTVLFMASHETFEIDIGSTLGIHNIDCLPAVYEWSKKLKEKFNWNDRFFGINPVFGHFGFDNATQDLKNIWLSDLELYKNHDWANHAIAMIQNSNNAVDNSVWINYLDSIDQRRGLNWKQGLEKLSANLEKINHLVKCL